MKFNLEDVRVKVTQRRKLLVIGGGVLLLSLVALGSFALGSGLNGGFMERAEQKVEAIEDKFDRDEADELVLSSRADRADWDDLEDWLEDLGHNLPVASFADLEAAVKSSSLSSVEKESVLKSFSAAKSELETLIAHHQAIEKVYEEKVGQLETAYTTLLTQNQSLWTKLATESDEDLDVQLSALEQEDLIDIKMALNVSTSLSDTEKSSLLADVTEIEKLKTSWSQAYDSLANQLSTLKTEEQSKINAVVTKLKEAQLDTSLLAQVFGGQNWDGQVDDNDDQDD